MIEALKQKIDDLGQRTADEDASDSDVLAGMLAASNDACWCMEFRIPVDLTASDHEIVRQIFENEPYWRFTNPAMARLYLLDPDVDFNSRPPSEIFPRSRSNEDYLMNVIANGFELDAAPAVDRRYDGKEIYVENDVRAHIRGGKLLRMYGVVRDVGKHRHREAQIKHALNHHLDIFAALPMGVLAADGEGRIIAVNPAGEKLLGVRNSHVAGLPLADLAHIGGELAAAFDRVTTTGATFELELTGLRWTVAPKGHQGIVACMSLAGHGGGLR